MENNCSSFWDKISEQYAAQPVKDEAGYADTLNKIRKYLTPTAHVLEVGGGTGSTALKLAGDARSIVSTDLSPGMIDIAKRKAETDGVSNISFQVADASKPPGEVQEYDAVLALNLLHLTADPPSVLSELHKKLKAGGVIATKTHGLGGKFMARMMIPVMQFFGKAPKVVSYFTLDELTKMHEKSGFHLLESTDYGNGERRLIIARKAYSRTGK